MSLTAFISVFAENTFTKTTFGHLSDKEGQHEVTNTRIHMKKSKNLNIPEREKKIHFI